MVCQTPAIPLQTCSNAVGQYRSIFLAGATFNLLPDDESAERALVRIADDGSLMSVTVTGFARDEEHRTQSVGLRYTTPPSRSCSNGPTPDVFSLGR